MPSPLLPPPQNSERSLQQHRFTFQPSQSVGHIGTSPPTGSAVNTAKDQKGGCPHDAFGDRFELDRLPLARPGSGYAVQYLGSDTLLDRRTFTFLPIRNAGLSGLFDSFDQAFDAARTWLEQQDTETVEHPLAIVPAFHDPVMERHVLIHGVLPHTP